MELIESDIAIIGGGAAGLRAATIAAEKYPRLKIALISKVYPVRSHTVAAEGGIAGVLREYDSFEKHAEDTIKGGDFLSDKDAVDFFVRRAPEEIIQLEHLGCPFSRTESGKIAMRAFGAMSEKRTAYAADKTGFYILHTLFELSLKYDNIKRYDEFFVTSLLRTENKITGLTAIDMRHGKMCSFAAKAVILATGGAGRMYSFTTNSAIKTGDGLALALRAGATLKDMEFVQFHPTALPHTGILMTEAARGEGGYLLNKKGERFMKNHHEKAEMAPRDIVTRAILSEIKAGRGFEGPYGQYVELDIRHLGKKTIEEKLPQVRELAMEFAGIDPVDSPIPVMPACHYFMGGISVNLNTETNLSGLYAAGESACTGIHGANRLGSNSLAECMVFGAKAGLVAVEFVSKASRPQNQHSQLENAESYIEKFLHQRGDETISEVRESLQKTMSENVGIERNKASLNTALVDIEKLSERWSKISLRDKNLVFNTELTSLLELKNMLDIAACVAKSALAREESRGAHFRTDFPHHNDAQFLKHFLINQSLTVTSCNLSEQNS